VILLLGGTGQLGRALIRALTPLDAVRAPMRAEADLADPDRLRALVRGARPRIVVNAAAYTDVERAEDEPAIAHAINGVAPGVLAEEAARAGALLVHYSTDYVFDGAKPAPYVESDAVAPLNAYGASKLAGERAIAAAGGSHLILRTSWVYAAEGRNFLNAILRQARAGKPLRVVADARGAPTWAGALADATAAILARGPGPAPGVYHLSAAGETTWHGFAARILARLAARDPAFPRVAVEPQSSAALGLKAKRPANSMLDNARVRAAFGVALASWEDQLESCLDERAPG
jgi:dTDP-4-dehydrorhamnose reductase